MKINDLRNLFIVGISIAIASALTFILNKDLITELTDSVLVITQDNFETESKNIKDNHIVKISGTPNLISRVDERNENGEISMRYFGLQDYNYRFIIASPKIEDLEKKEFIGKITKLNKIENNTNLLAELNKPLSELILPYLTNPTEQTINAVNVKTTSEYNLDTSIIWSGDHDSKINLIIFFKIATFFICTTALIYICINLLRDKLFTPSNTMTNKVK